MEIQADFEGFLDEINENMVRLDFVIKCNDEVRYENPHYHMILTLTRTLIGARHHPQSDSVHLTWPTVTLSLVVSPLGVDGLAKP